MTIFKIVLGIFIAFITTPFFIQVGFDWWWAKLSERWILLQYISLPGIFIGFIVPFAFPYYYFKNRRINPNYEAIALRAFAASSSAWVISTCIKAFTARVPREPLEALGMLDFSNTFRFGFMEGVNLWENLIEGYPSGHAMTAFAMVIAVLPLFSDIGKRYLLMYAFYISIGVSLTVHWFSDSFSGAVLGIAVGKVVGELYSNR